MEICSAILELFHKSTRETERETNIYGEAIDKIFSTFHYEHAKKILSIKTYAPFPSKSLAVILIRCIRTVVLEITYFFG
jgi:hypothetical protein